MEQQHLNLARKWRSKTFDTIVGQELPVRMLKNSLYLQHFFPVYLLSGQRGCGKTTTARVFAAAVNCEQLPEFQKHPKNISIPCLECASCQAMGQGAHPDFIEIDAASHTGVDNVRTIIDAASFMPLSGRKKIYLIDEAHMLSKAAFNAFLKILEDPPPSVLFMLATTDPQKIIQTVTSRSFQLFFPPIKNEALHAHLRNVCDTESIKADDGALALMVRESEGSARDALNLLEQVRFSSEAVTTDAVLNVLGHVSDEIMSRLLVHLLQGTYQNVLSFIADVHLETYAPERVYHKLLHFVRSALWVSYGVALKEQTFDPNIVSEGLVMSSKKKIEKIMRVCCTHEQAFLRTTKKHLFLETMFLDMCSDMGVELPRATIREKAVEMKPNITQPIVQSKQEASLPQQQQPVHGAPWEMFLKELNKEQDPLISSMFSQAKCLQHDATCVSLQFGKQLSFFQDLIQEGRTVWAPVLKKIFGEGVELKTSFDGDVPVNETALKENIEKTTQSQTIVRQAKQVSRTIKREVRVDVSDEEAWKYTHAILKQFPGTVTEIVGENDEESA